MKITTVKCDECGVVKEESNHWLHMDVLFREGGKVLIRLGEAEDLFGYERHDICGQGCFHRHLDKLLFPEKAMELFVEPVHKPSLNVPLPYLDDDSPF